MGRGGAGARSACRSQEPSAENFISVDIETDGAVPGLYSILALGAALVGDPAQHFYCELRPISERFEPEALAVSGLDRVRLLREGMDPAVAIAEFASWARGLGPDPVFCSFASFDWMFVSYYFHAYGVTSPFGHTGLDMKSFYLGAFGGRWRETKMSVIRTRRPELVEPASAHTHHALDDAREQAAFLGQCLAATRRP